ncbi:hypothetical protein UMZ34_01440 [Halopseudomonas pachastrellae]|nr:hypothetical protein UMZ34_01440 [Halopseudomonas pachastrellae]
MASASLRPLPAPSRVFELIDQSRKTCLINRLWRAGLQALLNLGSVLQCGLALGCIRWRSSLTALGAAGLSGSRHTALGGISRRPLRTTQRGAELRNQLGQPDCTTGAGCIVSVNNRAG